MSHWNYRVIRQVAGEEILWGIHEVYYAEDGHIEGWTTNAIDPRGNTLEELAADLTMMQRALTEPVLTVAEDGHTLVDHVGAVA